VGADPGPHGSLRAVAMFETAKGALVLLAGLALLSLLHRDVGEMAQHLVRRLHLNPASHLPREFIRWAQAMTGSREALFAGAAFLYAGVRFVEAYGLWFARSWAEWFAAVSGAIYLPFELREVLLRPGPWPALLLVANLLVVAVMVRAIWLRRRAAPPALT
jgi:uncharacterized membrane protein (DUF2068 family)